jgi:hypothetical protein
LRNRETLADHLFVRYEDVCDHPGGVARRLSEFISELGSLDGERVFEVMDQTGRIRNLNEQQIARLDAADLAEINAILEPHRDLVGRSATLSWRGEGWVLLRSAR